jgi:hypothetical protein
LSEKGFEPTIETNDLYSEPVSSCSSEADDSDFGMMCTIGEATANSLLEKESLDLSTMIRIKHQDMQSKVKSKIYAGIAPTRFNLGKHRIGKYVSRITFSHKWESQKARINWQKLRSSVLSAATYEYDIFNLDDDTCDQLRYNVCLIQGFQYQRVLRRPQKIISIIHNLKIPAHLQDGTMGHEMESEFTKTDKINREEDNEDFYNHTASLRTPKSYSMIVIDSKRYLTIWDINGNPEPRLSVKMNFQISHIIFLTKYCLYAGLVNQQTVKVGGTDVVFQCQIRNYEYS